MSERRLNLEADAKDHQRENFTMQLFELRSVKVGRTAVIVQSNVAKSSGLYKHCLLNRFLGKTSKKLQETAEPLVEPYN